MLIVNVWDQWQKESISILFFFFKFILLPYVEKKNKQRKLKKNELNFDDELIARRPKTNER